MARRAPSVRDKVITALQDFTQRELAAQLGVSVRTIRRWKNEGVQPANPFVALALSDEYQRIKKYVARANRREHAPQVRTPIPVVGLRSDVIVRDQEGRDTGARAPSDWVNYDTTRLEQDDTFRALRAIADKAGPDGVTIQLIYKVPRSPQYPRGRSGTVPFEIHSEMTDVELYDETIGSISQAQVLYIGVVT